ncbi:entry exclusion lipoprotein TrbK [Rugamonas rivuli]
MGASLLTVVILLGCTRTEADPKLPEVNDQNCVPEKYTQIHDTAARNRFIDLCAKMSTYKPSKPRGW